MKVFQQLLNENGGVTTLNSNVAAAAAAAMKRVIVCGLNLNLSSWFLTPDPELCSSLPVRPFSPPLQAVSQLSSDDVLVSETIRKNECLYLICLKIFVRRLLLD